LGEEPRGHRHYPPPGIKNSIYIYSVAIKLHHWLSGGNMSSQLSSSQVRVKTGQIPEKIFVKLYEDQSNLHRAFPTKKKSSSSMQNRVSILDPWKRWPLIDTHQCQIWLSQQKSTTTRVVLQTSLPNSTRFHLSIYECHTTRYSDNRTMPTGSIYMCSQRGKRSYYFFQLSYF
jgi:hypothetical protein